MAVGTGGPLAGFGGVVAQAMANSEARSNALLMKISYPVGRGDDYTRGSEAAI
jgi:hypothetical protein